MSFPSSIVVLRYPESVVESVVRRSWKIWAKGETLIDEDTCVEASREALRQLQPVVTVPPEKRLHLAFRNFDVNKIGKIDFASFRQIVVQYHDYHASRNEANYREYVADVKRNNLQPVAPRGLPLADIIADQVKQVNENTATTTTRQLEPGSLTSNLPRGGKWDLVSDIVFPAHITVDIREVCKDYQISEQALGEGSFGKVYLAIHRATGARRVVKTINLTSPQQASLIKEEISLMKRLNHPNILRLHETYHCGYRIFLILELCEGGPLYDRLANAKPGELTESQLALWLQQILSAISFCHDRGVLHRDIKPENILFVSTKPDSPLKIIDFGLSSTIRRIRGTATPEVAASPPSGRVGFHGALARIFSNSQRRMNKFGVRMQCAGTPHYMAPEMIRGQYDEKCDIFSVGVILYQMLCGRHPFFVAGVDNRDTVRVKILQQTPSTDTSEWQGISAEAKQLVEWMLQKDPRKRCSAREALAHTWVSRVGRNGKKDPAKLTKSVFEGLREWQNQNRLRQAICVLLAQEMSESQIGELRHKFEAFDLSGDGTISLDEMRKAINESGVTMDDAEIRRVFESLDRSGTRVIYYTEFISALLAKRVQIEERQLRTVFEKLDLEREGKISVQDLHRALKGCRAGSLSEKEALQHILKADLNGDGYIDFEEFAIFMKT